MANKKYQITALIYDKKGNLVAKGSNSYIKTHPLQAKYAKEAGEPEKIYLHAEIDAIIALKKPHLAHKMVVLRHTHKGIEGYAKPCPVCMHAISKTSIKEVEWSL